MDFSTHTSTRSQQIHVRAQIQIHIQILIRIHPRRWRGTKLYGLHGNGGSAACSYH